MVGTALCMAHQGEKATAATFKRSTGTRNWPGPMAAEPNARLSHHVCEQGHDAPGGAAQGGGHADAGHDGAGAVHDHQGGAGVEAVPVAQRWQDDRVASDGWSLLLKGLPAHLVSVNSCGTAYLPALCPCTASKLTSRTRG